MIPGDVLTRTGCAVLTVTTRFRCLSGREPHTPTQRRPTRGACEALWDSDRGGPTIAVRSLLPAVVRERLVRFSHAVRVFLLLHGVAFALGRRDHLGCELLGHRLLVAVARVADEPAHGEGSAALGTHLDGHLVGGATDAAALHLHDRFEVRERLLEDVHAWLARARLDEIHGAVEEALGRRLLALQHEGVDELRNGLAVVARIGQNRALHRLLAAAHFLPPAAPALGRLVPYFERLWLRPFTPDASRVPRTM